MSRLCAGKEERRERVSARRDSVGVGAACDCGGVDGCCCCCWRDEAERGVGIGDEDGDGKDVDAMESTASSRTLCRRSSRACGK